MRITQAEGNHSRFLVFYDSHLLGQNREVGNPFVDTGHDAFSLANAIIIITSAVLHVHVFCDFDGSVLFA